MRTAHFIAKHHKSFLDYKHICELDKMKGLDVGTSYTTDKGGATLLQSISSVTRAYVCQSITSAKFFSFTCDGSSDFTGDDYESIYTCTCTNGIIQDQFLSIGIAKFASSSDIHDHICENYTRLGLENEFKAKLVGFCSDGASNMQGHKSGLVALLRKTHPHIVTVHCLAHRLELAFKDTIKKVPLYEKMMTLLLGLYYLYRKSPKLKMGLKRSFEAHQTKMLLPTRVGGTRWLPHLDLAIRNFIRGYKAVRSHLESSSHTSPKAEGLAKIAGDSNLLGFVLSLQAVIQPLVRLSLNLQKDDQTLADDHCHVEATRAVLSHLTEKVWQYRGQSCNSSLPVSS
ncbi:E3 SUMO-protein ligase KIAA1586-like [Mercenaria mercenaria]|uniref:E3 SUMO-protein ligase KIAA1586-like n=1 Tax=Mercenaria mercenaria TaxID=6596 RepID=UPI00234EC9FE|nr:E3 SUMO-protein ligase KIAA1586-like [Mercenaria mercenaria]